MMNEGSKNAGDLDHLIERLRLSDNRASHRNQNPIGPPPGFNPPGNWGPQQAAQGSPFNASPYTSPAVPRHQAYGHPWPPAGRGYSQNSQHTPRQVSLMDYMKAPRNQHVGNKHPSMDQNTGFLPPDPARQTQNPRHQQPMLYASGNTQQPNRPRLYQQPAVSFSEQSAYLDHLASIEIPKVAVSPEEVQQKDAFRAKLEAVCQRAFRKAYPESTNELHFIPYGSMLSGFAVTGSDMDIICAWDEQPPDLAPEVIPRLFQAAVLAEGFGARALTNTRVPILKICEKPSEELKSALLNDHEEWKVGSLTADGSENGPNLKFTGQPDANDKNSVETPQSSNTTPMKSTQNIKHEDGVQPQEASDSYNAIENSQENNIVQDLEVQKSPRVWLREKAQGPLDFPKSGVGFQCDISFRSLLGVNNTQLLRCYSACDPRVRDMVLFVKAWASRRKINSSYSGTLCSYGWVLLVLHFLINVATPPVLPNLQTDFRAAHKPKIIDGYEVAFADDEVQLRDMALHGRMTRNTESLGSLLCNFFHYYAHQGQRVIGGGFRWRTDVVSIRTLGGTLTKASKGWTGAKNTTVNNIKVQQRYLLAVECPLEINHNVARTVHHSGIVAIRDELRRTWNILEAIGQGRPPAIRLFDEASNVAAVASSPGRQKQFGTHQESKTTEGAFR